MSDIGIFDSKEELYVYWWLKELQDNGFIIHIDTNPESFILSEEVKEKLLKTTTKGTRERLRTILREHIYTTDFKVTWDKKAKGIFYKTMVEPSDEILPFVASPEENITYLEVKPLFDQNNMERLFTVNQKWMYDKYRIFINKVIPIKQGKTGKSSGLFNNTFVPQRYLRTDTGRQARKINFNYVTLKQFLNYGHNQIKGIY